MRLTEQEVARLVDDLIDNVTDKLYDKAGSNPDADFIYDAVTDQLHDAVMHELSLVEVNERG